MECMCKDCGYIFETEAQKDLCNTCCDKPRRSPIIAFDFDGTLCEHDFPRIGPSKRYNIVYPR